MLGRQFVGAQGNLSSLFLVTDLLGWILIIHSGICCQASCCSRGWWGSYLA